MKPVLKRLPGALATLGLTLGAMMVMTAPAMAWWETGHMLTAQIGYDNLRPEIRAKADKLIAHLDNTEPDAARHHFVPVSVWMDDTKARGLNAFNEWHYINIPYNPLGLPKAADAKETNIVQVMSTMAETLRSDKASPFEKAFALRILLHLFGDVHQPFHAVGRLSHDHPEGDLGGNRTYVDYPNMKNIHAFWDSTAGLMPEVKPPQWQGQIPGLSRDLQQEFPRSKQLDSMAFNPQGWAEESFKLAVKYGYQPLEDGINQLAQPAPLSEAYIRNAKRVCGERLALGGYRLAELLNATL